MSQLRSLDFDMIESKLRSIIDAVDSEIFQDDYSNSPLTSSGDSPYQSND